MIVIGLHLRGKCITGWVGLGQGTYWMLDTGGWMLDAGCQGLVTRQMFRLLQSAGLYVGFLFTLIEILDDFSFTHF